MRFPSPGYYDGLFKTVELPPMAGVTIHYNDDRVQDVAGTVRRELLAHCGRETVGGKTVAVAVGSRGLANLTTLVKTTVDVLRELGAEVLIVPAMGSHGGATEEGQVRLLEHLGISEEAMGVPIQSNMQPVVIGHTKDGVPVYFDACAAAADYTVTIARVKPHTGFRGQYESGMVKMNVIGLGKQRGADYCHAMGMENMAENLQKIGQVSIERSNLLLSLCVVENAYDETYLIRAVPREEILTVEPELLKIARSLMPEIPFKNLDVLIVDEIGKNITGAGMDPNIIQRFASVHMPAQPFVKQLVILDLTPESDGNANGTGFADVATKRMYDKIDVEKAYTNALTARVSLSVKIPMIMDNDATAIKAGLKLSSCASSAGARIVRIRNTLSLNRMEISKALLPEAAKMAGVQVSVPPKQFNFDDGGDLPKSGFLYGK